MGDRLANIDGDSDYRTLEENEEQMAKGEGNTSNQTHEENEEDLAERNGDTNNETLEEKKESLADSKGDTADHRLEENEGRRAERNITYEDAVQKFIDMLTVYERILYKAEVDEEQVRRTTRQRVNRTEDKTAHEVSTDLPDTVREIDNATVEYEKGISAEWMEPIADLCKEQLESLADSKGDTADHTLEENEAERFAESTEDTDDQKMEENEGIPDEMNRAYEGLLEKHLVTLPGFLRMLQINEVDAGAASELELQLADLTKEQIKQLLGTGRKLVDPTVKTKGTTADLKELEDILKMHKDMLDILIKSNDLTSEDIKGKDAESMELITGVCKEQLEQLAAIIGKETENSTTKGYNEGMLQDLMGLLEDAMAGPLKLAPCLKKSMEFFENIRGPLAEIQLNVDDLKANVAESMEIAETFLDRLPGLPREIRRMDKVSQNLFREALEAGKEKVYNIRLMIVGHHGVGKTTLAKRILGENVKEGPHVSTEGIEVHPRCLKIDIATQEWIAEGTEYRFPDTSQLLVEMITKHVKGKSKKSTDGDNQVRKKQNTDKEEGSFATDGPVSASSKPNTHEQNYLIYRRQGDTGINKNMDSSDLQRFVNMYRTRTLSKKVSCYVTMLDFAGQFVFYSTYQAFMSWRTIYLLVTDMSKGLDEVVKDDTCSMIFNSNVERSIKDYVVFWLNSIYSHGITAEASSQCEGSIQQETENHKQDHRGEGKYPPVILVATHSDKVPKGEKEETKEIYFDGVRKILKERPLRYMLKEYFAFSNFGPETDIDTLKQKIVELAKQQNYWGEEIPGRWLALEQKLMELKRNGVKIIKYSRVEEINNLSDVKIENPDELEVFLRFEHDLGNIVFFPTTKLREKVVLDQEWLMDAVKILISPPRQLLKDPNIYPNVYTFKDTGQLAKSLIGSIWSGREHEDFQTNQDHLLDLLERLSIIAKPVDQDSSIEKEYYWVPCVIYKSAPDHVKNPKPHEDMTKSSTLCFESTTKFLHIGVFHRLVASFLSQWTPAQEEEGGEYHLYHGCCEFEVDQCHNLLLDQNDYVISVTMFRYSSGGVYPDNELCNTVKNLISSTLADITTCVCPNSKFDIKVKCRKSTDTIKGLHSCSDKTEKRCTCSSPCHTVNVAELMSFWEVGPRQSEMASDDSKCNKQGSYENLVVQEETRVSHSGDMKAEIDQTKPVFFHKQIAQIANSVGIIRATCTCGTGFRVGGDYIMTAKHVVDNIIYRGPVPLQQQTHLDPVAKLSDANVFIDFSYERDGHPIDENLKFHFLPEIVYANDDLDTVILKLKPENKEYPPPLTNFHNIEQSPHGRRHGRFIGHSKAEIKKIDKYELVKLTPDQIIACKEWSMKYVNVDGFDGIDKQGRVLFHCSFERGASGSPGFWINPSNGQAYVELMLLKGYPTWYYDDNYKDKIAGIPNNSLIEQGVSMKSVYEDMMKKDEYLCKAVFHIIDSDEEMKPLEHS